MCASTALLNTARCRRPWPPTFEPAKALWAMAAAHARRCASSYRAVTANDNSPTMTTKSWLARWKDLIASKCDNLPILELGCGIGRDTKTLTEYGHRVIAIDVSRDAINVARELCETAEYHHQDMKHDWPVSRNGAGVILASLSLHYFGRYADL